MTNKFLSALPASFAALLAAVLLLTLAPLPADAAGKNDSRNDTGTVSIDALRPEDANSFAAPANTGAAPATAAAATTGPEATLDARDKAYVEQIAKQTGVYFYVIILISVVAVIFLSFLLYMVSRGTRDLAELSGRDMMRAAVVTFVAYGAIVIALTMQNTETLTGVTGLLSAIVGYVFGRAGGDDRERLALAAGRAAEAQEPPPSTPVARGAPA